MSYYTNWLLAETQSFMNRCGMCAEQEGHGFDWGIDNRRLLASAPGFGEAFASALAGGMDPEEAGRDEAVISDQMLLAATQAIAPGGDSDG